MNRVNQTAIAESELQRALDCGELIRLYQPIVDLATDEPVGVEALLRWDNPTRGLLAPREFLLDEDDNALLVRIGWSVVIEAVRRAGDWRRTFPDRPITVSVNLSAGHLERRDLSARVEHLLVDNEVPGPRALAFEVGERHLLSQRLRARDRLTALRNLDVDIVVDDFGATAAATDVEPDELRDSALELLESLAKFPLDVVKLDPRFVTRLDRDARIAEVVDAAHAAGFRVVALAVEDEDDVRRALAAGFDLAQGFHYFRPERPAYVDQLLADR
jgi:EAL domain-containing protein (putative c-di-GMP-specific phosphodiesterase class I)